MAEGKTVSSGNISMLLLQLLSEKDMYGYEMIEELEKRSEYVFSLKAGTMYPVSYTHLARPHFHTGFPCSWKQSGLSPIPLQWTITL